MSAKVRILAVADPAAGPAELIEMLRTRAGRGASVTLLVPALLRGTSLGGEPLIDWSLAVDRAEAWAGTMRRAGIDVAEAIVGDPDPLLAAGDAMHARAFDEVLASFGARPAVPAVEAFAAAA